MLGAFALVCAGLVLLTYGADRFVEGAAATAYNLGVQPLLVGLVVVGFATSAPEMLVSGVAALGGNPTVGIGNAIGSNIANIGLVLGATALLAPLTVRSAILQREFPLMIAVLLLATWVLSDRILSRSDGAVLLVGLVLTIGATMWLGLRARGGSDALLQELDKEIVAKMTTPRALAWVAVGLALLLAGSQMLVTGAVDIARAFGVSDVVIGLTIVAVGTSLPELAASIASALKNEPDIALGNVIGSNMFNALAVLAMPALIRPSGFEDEVVTRDVPMMLVMTAALFLMSFTFRNRPGRISRFDGALLLGAFLVYQLVLFVQK